MTQQLHAYCFSAHLPPVAEELTFHTEPDDGSDENASNRRERSLPVQQQEDDACGPAACGPCVDLCRRPGDSVVRGILNWFEKLRCDCMRRGGVDKPERGRNLYGASGDDGVRCVGTVRGHLHLGIIGAALE